MTTEQPRGYHTREQIRHWAEDVYHAFMEYISGKDFWGYEHPAEDDPEDWDGDYKYEGMDANHIVTLLCSSDVQKRRLIDVINEDNANGKISDELCELFSAITFNLGINLIKGRPNTDLIKFRILQILFTKVNNQLGNDVAITSNYPEQYIPKTSRKEFKYFREQVYNIIDSAIDVSLQDQRVDYEIISNQSLYRAEKTNNKDAQSKRRVARDAILQNVRNHIVTGFIDMSLPESAVIPAITIARGKIYDMFPTFIKTQQATSPNNACCCSPELIASSEEQLDRVLLKKFSSEATSQTDSPGMIQQKKSGTPYDRQTQIAPSDEPYEVPQS